MSLFAPTTQPTAVTSTGVIVAVSIPVDYRTQRVARILVSHTAGTLNTFTVEASTDPTLTNLNMRIATVVNARNGDVVDVDNNGIGYLWDGEDRINWSSSPKNIYIQIIPDAGTDNSFVVGLYLEKR